MYLQHDALYLHNANHFPGQSRALFYLHTETQNACLASKVVILVVGMLVLMLKMPLTPYVSLNICCHVSPKSLTLQSLE